MKNLIRTYNDFSLWEIKEKKELHNLDHFVLKVYYYHHLKQNCYPKKEFLMMIQEDTDSLPNSSFFVVYDNISQIIDFTSDIPFLFDDICCSMGIPVLHPLNLGWGAGVIVVDNTSRKLSELYPSYNEFELHLARHILNELDHKNIAPSYLNEIIKDYNQVKDEVESPPQLSVGSWVVASMCTRLMYYFCINMEVRTFPEVYFQAI